MASLNLALSNLRQFKFNKVSIVNKKMETFVMYDKKDVEVVKCEPLYQGFFRCNKYTLRHKLFSGEWSGLIEREFFERGKAAGLLAYDVAQDKVVLVEQFRFGAIQSEGSPWLFELIAGIIEEGEEAQEVVKREAFEEAGLVIGKCQFMMSYLVSPGGTTETLDLFVANVDSTNVEGVFGLAEESEDIRVHVLPRTEAYDWVKTGKINNAATIIGLQWLELNRENGLNI